MNVERASARKGVNDFEKSSGPRVALTKSEREDHCQGNCVSNLLLPLLGISQAFLAQTLFRPWPSCLVSFVVWHEGLSWELVVPAPVGFCRPRIYRLAKAPLWVFGLCILSKRCHSDSWRIV